MPGTGQLVGGGILVGLGALDLLAGAVLLGLRNNTSDPTARDLLQTSARINLVVGGVEAAAGTVLLITGTRARRRYRSWAARNGLTPPKSGNGLLVGGSALAASGLAGILLGAATDSGTPLSYTVDALYMASGGALLIAGGIRRSRYNRWLESNRLTLAPSLAPSRRGVMVGLSGRF